MSVTAGTPRRAWPPPTVQGGSAYVDKLLAQPFQLYNAGDPAIPDLIGPGVCLDHDAVSRYSPAAARLFA